MRLGKLTTSGLGVLVMLVATAAPAAPAQAAAPAATRDPCLTGAWRVSGSDALDLLQKLMPLPTWTVPEGTVTLTFRRGKMAYGSTYFVIKQSFGDLQLSAAASWITEAPYRTKRGRILLGPGLNQVDIAKFTGIKDGQTVTVDGPGVSSSTTAAGSVPYRCTRRTLSWPVPVGAGAPTRVTFKRG